jgi:hypothetical protein
VEGEALASPPLLGWVYASRGMEVKKKGNGLSQGSGKAYTNSRNYLE